MATSVLLYMIDCYGARSDTKLLDIPGIILSFNVVHLSQLCYLKNIQGGRKRILSWIRDQKKK